jgi:hypothetical protein
MLFKYFSNICNVHIKATCQSPACPRGQSNASTKIQDAQAQQTHDPSSRRIENNKLKIKDAVRKKISALKAKAAKAEESGRHLDGLLPHQLLYNIRI